MYIFILILLYYPSIYLMIYWISEKGFNRGDSICYISISPIFPHKDAFFHGAHIHVECLNNIKNNYMATLEPYPVPFFVDRRKLDIGKRRICCLKRWVISLFGSQLKTRFPRGSVG